MKYDLNALPGDADNSTEPKSKNRRGETSASGNDSSVEGKRFLAISRRAWLRHIAFVFVVVACSGIALWRRDEVLEQLGWSLVPLGVWVLVFVYLLLARTMWIVKGISSVASSLLICLGGAAVLGIFDAPLGAVSGATMGGKLGEILAREPFDWDRYNIEVWQQIQGWVRACVFFAVGAWIQFPTGSAAAAKVSVVGILMAMSTVIGLASSSASVIASASSKLGRSAKTDDEHSEKTDMDLSESGPKSDAKLGQKGAIAATGAIANEAEVEISKISHRNRRAEEEADPLSRVVVGLGQTIYAKPNPVSISAEAPDVGDATERASATTGGAESSMESEAKVMLSDLASPEQGELEVSIHRAPNGMAVEEDELIEWEGAESFTEDRDIGPSLDVEIPSRSLDEGGAASFGQASRLEVAIRDFPWYLPPVDFMADPPGGGVSAAEIESTSQLIEETLAQHAVEVTVDQVRVGPTITMYGLNPGWKDVGPNSKSSAQRVRVDAILNREKDIALALKCPNIRFESVVPGSSVVGIEVPNADPTPVNLRSVIDTDEWRDLVEDAALPVPLGMGSGGDPVMADFAKMPHTLVAGATGSGKSVCMNTIIASLLLYKTPIELRMVMIDPKRVELTPYDGIPHLYTPVVVESDRAVAVLKALTREMMGRFATLESAGVKNIAAYNDRAEIEMPYLLVLVDELADLMLTASNEVEQLLVRLAQLGRATGVHLVVATQRPSVDVVTGLIKANFPSRISFSVMSQVDSRTILDSNGAEKLLGRGDMLYKPIDLSKPVRVQGAYVDEAEVESVVDYWVRSGSPPLPQLDVDGSVEEEIPGLSNSSDSGDSLFAAASDLARNQKTLSTSLLQRRLKIGYPRAARLMDELEEAGMVGPGEPGKPRKVILA